MQFIKKNREAQVAASKPQFRLKKWVAAFALGMTVISTTSVHAGEAEEVSNLMRQSRYDQALARAEAYLATNPSDAQMRFLKGLILTERNKENEAITVFTKLTEDFPELPE
ncbi:MAG: tetratricopeptide repeat protein, partial [Limnobacter sp.]|nr:tetratricopeptide repeat protein [Limnobacter sp.]